MKWPGDNQLFFVFPCPILQDEVLDYIVFGSQTDEQINSARLIYHGVVFQLIRFDESEFMSVFFAKTTQKLPKRY